jgi:folate-binding protein YgfZ
MSSPLPPSFSLARAPTLAGQARLVHLGVMRALGADAVAFLQGQLTQDVALMGPQDARLAAYCNAKGRMQASFIVVQPRPDELLLVCRRDVLPAMVKRLSMFVLRSKVKLSDASDEFTLLGLAGEQAVHPRPWQRRDEAGAQVISLYPGAGVPLALWLAPAQEPLPQGPALEPAAWQWLMVRSGIALVGQDSFEAYVPQMLNYESVGGVSFKKGCYPGQEVVARSQFRGTLKRRAYLAHAQGPVATGQEVFHALEPSQPCGSVAAAAACPDGAGWDAIVCLQVSAAEEACAGLRAQGADGPALDLMELPYPLLVDL